MNIMLLANAWYNKELNRYYDGGDDDVNSLGPLFEGAAKPRKQIPGREGDY